MPLFLPLTILSSAAAVHIRQNMWGQTNRLEKCFVKICWDSCWILRLVCTRQKGAAENQMVSNAMQFLQVLVWYTRMPQSCLQRSAVWKHCEGMAAVASPSVSLSLVGRISWTGTAAQADFSLAYLFTYDPTLLCFTGTWYLSLHNFKLLFARLGVVVSCNGSSQVFSVLSSLSQASLRG